MNEIEVVLSDVDDDAAALIMVSGNFEHHDKILPVEKDYAYRMMLEALKRQGKRTDLTCAQVGHKLNGKNRGILWQNQQAKVRTELAAISA